MESQSRRYPVGVGLPHSTTLRRKRRAIDRVRVVQCGSPMPLSFLPPGTSFDPHLLPALFVVNLSRR